MKLPHFVTGTSLALLGWLAATFAYDMPCQRYPKPDKSPAKIAEIKAEHYGSRTAGAEMVTNLQTTTAQ